MDFEWENHAPQALGSLKAQDVEESFEDPFAYRANGRQIQVIHARHFEAEERFFYERQQDKLLNQKTAI